MISPITASKVYSVLGNNDSLIPMAIKDTSNSLGLTAGSYITGQEAESQDRLIDEFGTQALWLLGIPAYKKILDWTLFKPLGFDAGVDVRILKDKEVFSKAKKFAKLHDEKYKSNENVKKIAKSLENITTKQKTYKGLTFGKFVASTLLTILSYGALTDFRQNYREKKITKEFYEKQAKLQQDTFSVKSQPAQVPNTFGGINFRNQSKRNNDPAFTGHFNIQDFMFSPVKNLMLVDGTITTERLAKSQNRQEFIGYAIKEGSFWIFMYMAGGMIKSWLENRSLNKHNIPINLDARVIESDELKSALLNKEIMHNVNQFPVGNPTAAEIYEFVNTNPDNLIVKMAKKCDVIKTIKNTELRDEKTHKPISGTGSIDNRKFIDPEEIKAIRDHLKTLWDKSVEAGNAEKFLEKVKHAKRGATLKNIGACIGFLGVLMPAMIVAWRFMDKDNKEYQVRADIEKKLRDELNAKTQSKA